jgi:hypothetical protein
MPYLRLSSGLAIISVMVISLNQLQENPYLFTNYVHQNVDLPKTTNLDNLKQDFYTRIETFMSSKSAQKAFEEVVEDEHFGFNQISLNRVSDENLKKMHLQEAINAVEHEAKVTLMGKYYKAIVDASNNEFRRVADGLSSNDEKDKFSSILSWELRFFQEGLSNALQFAFGFAGLIPKLYKQKTGENINAYQFKDILKRNLKLLNTLCGMQIEIFNQLKKQVMDIHKDGCEVKGDGFELGNINGLSLVPKPETAQSLIQTVKKQSLVLPVFGCPVLRVKYQKDKVPFFDRMHQWIEDLIDKHIIKNLDSIKI